MKKSIMLMAIMAVTLTAHGQQVFKEIYDSSFKTASDKNEDVTIRKIAAFKVDALTYLNTKIFELVTDESEVVQHQGAELTSRRDSLAYFMYDYVNYFLVQYQRAEKPKNKEYVIKLFQQVSLNHPLFRDHNREAVFVYVDREDYLTRFSLDTDWVAANREVRRLLRELQ